MPAPPEINYRCCTVWAIEVLCEIDVKEAGASQRHVSIAGEIHVNLEGIGISGQKQRQSTEGMDIVIDGIHVETEAVRNHYLLEKSQVNSSMPNRMLS